MRSIFIGLKSGLVTYLVKNNLSGQKLPVWSKVTCLVQKLTRQVASTRQVIIYAFCGTVVGPNSEIKNEPIFSGLAE